MNAKTTRDMRETADQLFFDLVAALPLTPQQAEAAGEITRRCVWENTIDPEGYSPEWGPVAAAVLAIWHVIQYPEPVEPTAPAPEAARG